MSARKVFSPSALRSRRKHLHLSREAVAGAVLRSYATLTNYERGITTPTAEVIAALAEVLECDPGDLFEAEDVLNV